MEHPEKEPESLAQIQFETLAGMRGTRADKIRVARQIRAEIHAREKAEKLARGLRDWRDYAVTVAFVVVGAAVLASTRYACFQMGFQRGAAMERSRPSPIEQQLEYIESRIQLEGIEAKSEVREAEAWAGVKAKRIQELQTELERLRGHLQQRSDKGSAPVHQ